MFKNIFKKIILLLLVITPFGIVINVKADSGWDSSYDSGGSWSSGGYDYDYNRSWSSDSDRVRSTGPAEPREFTIFDLVLIVAFIFVIYLLILNSKKNKIEDEKFIAAKKSKVYNDINESFLKEILPTWELKKLKIHLFNKFTKIQNAWMNFEYDNLRELCTDELYNSYIGQLAVLKLKNGKNIMNKYRALDIKIIDVKKEAGTIVVSTFMKISFYDYVIDTTNNSIIRGSNKRKITNEYIMNFVIEENIKSDVKCPNCGALVKNTVSCECEYCGSTIVKNADDFVLSKKTNINK